MIPRSKGRRYVIDADALKAVFLYGGATVLLGLACARDIARSFDVVISATEHGATYVVGR